MRKVYEYDLYRIAGKSGLLNIVKSVMLQPKYKVVFYKRMCEKYVNAPLRYTIFRLIYEHVMVKYGFDCGASTKIGPGFVCGHIGAIAINNQSVIGTNVEILQGVTIGVEKRGSRQGAPTIGNNVWIGSNSSVVGGVEIGDNVLIAANSFVNFDVPSNSIVLGSPGRIVATKENATEGYINNTILPEDIKKLSI